MVRTRCEVWRDGKGRFVKTNGNQKYKRKQRNGRYTSEHVLIWEDYHKKRVPKGYVIHHINENKKDNRIENLKAMLHSEHTKMHFAEYYKNRDIWNKGLTTHAGNNSFGHLVTNKTKQRKKFYIFNKYLESFINIWKLKDKNLTPTQISKQLNITIDKVNHRWKSFNKIYDTDSGRTR